MQITTKLVKTLPRGQITLPARFREELGIKKDTYLRAYIQKEKIILEPVTLDKKISFDKYIRSYTNEEIRGFLALDKLDVKTRKKAERLLRE